MQKLHLVGFTTDQKGLILSARRAARSGSFHLPVDETLADAIEELRERQAEEESEATELEEFDTTQAPRVESALPVREIQARLRQGRTVQDVAKSAGVEPGWVERFAAPVFAEQSQVITKVRGMALRRPRLGPSAHSIDDAVRHNLAERGVALSPEEFASAWSTRQLADGRWTVRFGFRHRGKDQVLRFDLDEAARAVVAADRPSSQLGYVAPAPSAATAAPERSRATKPSGEARPTAKRATVATGFRPEAAAKAVSRPAKERERASIAMGKAVTKRAVEGERAAARKAKEKQDARKRRERAAKAEEARKRRERAAAEKLKAASVRAKAAAKKAAAAKARRKQAAAQAKRAEAALVVAERAARKRASAKTTGRKTSAGKATGRKAPVTKAPARKAPVTRAPARKAPVRHAPVTEAPATRPLTRKAATSVPRVGLPPGPLAPLPTPAPRVPAPVRPVPPLGVLVADESRPIAGRALFRVGLAEPVAGRGESPLQTRDDIDGEAVRPWEDRVHVPVPTTGLAPPRPLDRPRRTRPLRAT